MDDANWQALAKKFLDQFPTYNQDLVNSTSSLEVLQNEIKDLRSALAILHEALKHLLLAVEGHHNSLDKLLHPPPEKELDF